MQLIRGFWSYARKNGVYADYYHTHMDKALDSAARSIRGVDSIRIFRDEALDPDLSLRDDHDWRKGLVEPLSHALLFFWCQSPIWLTRPNCLAEYRIFRASLAELVAECAPSGAIDVETLADLLVVRLPFEPVDGGIWPDIIAESRWPDELRALHAGWDIKHNRAGWIMPANSRPLQEGRSLNDLAHSFALGRTDSILRNLREALDALGGAQRVLTFLDARRPAFIATWLHELERINSGKPATVPATLAELALRKRAAAIRRDLGIEMCVVPASATASPMLVSAEPIMPHQIPANRSWTVETDSAGRALWDAAEAAELAALFEDEGLALPTVKQAQHIGALGGQDSACLRTLGLHWPDNLWVRDADGGICPLMPSHRPVPLFVVRSA